MPALPDSAVLVLVLQLAVREHGIEQLLHVFRRERDRSADGLKWGDEVEFHLIRFEGEGKDRRATVHLIAPAVLERLEAEERRGKL